LAFQTIGRKLGMYLNRRRKVKQEGERRNVFLRYLGEVATAVSGINETDREALYSQLLTVAQRKTAEADAKFDQRGRRRRKDSDFGDNVIIVDQDMAAALSDDETGESVPE